MQISSHEFPLQHPSRRGSITPIFKDSPETPQFNLNPFSDSSHNAGHSVRLSKPGDFSAAKKTFLADLKNYVPLGSLTTSLEIADSWFHNGWMEASIYSKEYKTPYERDGIDLCWLLGHQIFHKQSELFNIQLQRLLQYGWIRMFAGRDQAQKQSVIIRIYVLPDDVGRRFVDRDDKALRKRLMELMEQLDISCESWDGRKPKDQPIKQYKVESTNEDSLFYLFNTISSPSPLVSDVYCPFAKEAMDSLLGNLDLMPGLKTELYPYQKRSAALMIKREVEPVRTLDPRLEPLENPVGRMFYYDKMNGILLREQRVYEESRGGILAEVRVAAGWCGIGTDLL